MRTGGVEANLLRLNDEFNLAYVAELIEQKLEGTEKSILDEEDISFYRFEYERLRVMLEQAYQASTLAETPSGQARLNDLLIRLRIG